jgi:hypothetical protein
MKTTIGLVIALMLVGTSAYAQGGPRTKCRAPPRCATRAQARVTLERAAMVGRRRNRAKDPQQSNQR